MLGLLGDVPPSRAVLDVGGAHGQIARPLAKRGHPVTVVASAPVGGVARGAEGGVGGIEVVAGELTELPFTADAFEAVVCLRLLPHHRRWQKLVAELCRVASRAVVVDFPSTTSVNVLARPLFALKRRVEGPTTREFRTFRPSEIREAFARAGFRTNGSRGQYVWPMALHRAHGSASLARALEAPFRWTGLTRRFGSPVVIRAEPATPAAETTQ